MKIERLLALFDDYWGIQAEYPEAHLRLYSRAVDRLSEQQVSGMLDEHLAGQTNRQRSPPSVRELRTLIASTSGASTEKPDPYREEMIAKLNRFSRDPGSYVIFHGRRHFLRLGCFMIERHDSTPEERRWGVPDISGRAGLFHTMLTADLEHACAHVNHPQVEERVI